MTYQWFKFYGGEYLTDPKMKSFTACERQCWTVLMAHSSISECEGLIKHLEEKQLMLDAGVDPFKEEWKETEGVLKRFQEKGMIRISDNGTINLINWNKKQERQLTGYERTKRYRQNNGDKIKARNAVQKALASGKISRGKCEICMSVNAEAHHDSYEEDNWLKIRWLCKEHHEKKSS